MPSAPLHPDAVRAVLDGVDRQFVIRLRRSGSRWHASIVHGIAHLGEPGSGIYASGSQERTTRKALRTVSRIIADGHCDDATIRIERP